MVIARMQRRRSLARRSNAPSNVDTGGLPPLATTTAAAMQLTPETNGDLQRSASHLRAVARHARPSKSAHKKPQGVGPFLAQQSPRSLVHLKPLDRFTVPTVTSNNDQGDDDRVLAEIWRVATTTAKQHRDKVNRLVASVESNNDVHDRHRRSQKPEVHGQADDQLANGTTLARYRRLVGMHARKTLSRILVDATTRVGKNRLEDRCGGRIQRLARRFLGRRRRARVRYDQVVAVETLQGWWRIQIARRLLQMLRIEELAKQRLIARQVTAARKIQRCFRAHVLVCRAMLQELARQEELRRQRLEIRSRSVLVRAVLAWWQHKQTREPPPLLSDHLEGEWEPQPQLVSITSWNQEKQRPVECEVETHLHACNGSVVAAEPIPRAIVPDASMDLTSGPIQKLGDDETIDTSTPAKTAYRSRAEVDLDGAWSVANGSPRESLQQAGEVRVVAVGAGSPSACNGDPVRLSGRPGAVDSSPRGELLSLSELPDGERTTVGSPLSEAKLTESDAPRKSTIKGAAVVTGMPKFAVRRATRVVAHFLSSKCLPIARSRLHITHSAALRIQRLVRQRLAGQEVAFRRQLHLISLGSELQAHWLASEAALLACVFGASEFEAVREAGARQHDHSDHESDDDEDVAFGDDDDEDINEVRVAGPTWAEVFPTRSGRIPCDLRVDLTRGGPADRRAPSLGLWNWSWTSEQWEPGRDLFQQLRIPQTQHDP